MPAALRRREQRNDSVAKRAVRFVFGRRDLSLWGDIGCGGYAHVPIGVGAELVPKASPAGFVQLPEAELVGLCCPVNFHGRLRSARLGEARIGKKFIEAVMPDTLISVRSVSHFGRYSAQVRRLLAGNTVDQNRSWHITLRIPDATITTHPADLSPNHVISSIPSIRASRLSAKRRKLNRAATW